MGQKTFLFKFNLNCDKEFFLPFIGTINNVGQLFCYMLTGFLSDKYLQNALSVRSLINYLFAGRYGRKFVLIAGCLGSGLFGILRAFSINYTQFAIFEFFDSLLGAATYSTSFIIGLELVTPKLRTIFGTLLNCFYALGAIYLGLIAMLFPNFKTVLLITYIPTFITASYICILPQSELFFPSVASKCNHSTYWLTKSYISIGIRWLITKGFNEEAKKILLKASKINKTSLSQTSLLKLNEKVELRELDDAVDVGKGQTSSRVVLQIANISFLWFSTIFVYYGLNINAVYLEYWNKYISFIVSSFEHLLPLVVLMSRQEESGSFFPSPLIMKIKSCALSKLFNIFDILH